MRSYPPTLLLLVLGLMLIVAACDDDGVASDDSDIAASDSVEEVETEESSAEPEPIPTSKPEPTATPHPTATPEPEPTPALEPKPTAEPVAKYTEEELEKYLLSLEDMPTGWVVAEDLDDDIEDIDAPDTELICDSENLEDALDRVTTASVDSQSFELGPFLTQSVVAVPDSEEAGVAMQTIQNMFSCTEWTTTDDAGDEMVWYLNPVSFPTFGDDTFSSQVNTEIMGFSVEMDVVVVQERNFLMMIHWGIGGFDSQQSEEFVGRALEKLPD